MESNQPAAFSRRVSCGARWQSLAGSIAGIAVCVSAILAANAAHGEGRMVYVGTYTRGESEGIYILRIDLKTGALTPVGVARGVVNPSFLAIDPKGRFLYAVNEVADFQGQRSGGVSALAIDTDTGSLRLLNQQPSQGTSPCFVTVDQTGRCILVANYGSGSVAALPIGENGRLGAASATVQHDGSSVNPGRQQGPHAHSINLDAANRFAFAADLGLDKILIYRFDAGEGTLVPNAPASVSVEAGAGPRHFAFHPSGKTAYVINELDCTVTVFSYDSARGELTTLQTISTLPLGFDGNNSTAEIQVHPSGRFVFGSNRGHHSIVVFAVDPDSGQLTYVENQSTQGKTPRGFGIDPSGTFLLAANQDSDNIVVFRIDQDTGALKPTGHSLHVPTPVCVKVMPAP